MTFFRKTLAGPALFAIVACSGTDDNGGAPPPSPETSMESGAADQASRITVEGRLREGVECATLATPDGDVWSVQPGEADVAAGDYVRIEGEIADASFCQQGRGTLVAQTITEIEPPARDRDPARAGGIAVTSDYVLGSWVAKGVDADCARPDFAITRNGNGGSIIETGVNGIPATGYVDVGESPALQWPSLPGDEGIPTMPIEARGPDGLAVMPGEGRTVSLAGHRIEGDGVVFVKCAA